MDHRLNQGRSSLRVGKVCLHEDVGPPRKRIARLLRRLTIAQVVNGHPCSMPGELLRDDSADTARGAGDKDHPVGEVHSLPPGKDAWHATRCPAMPNW